MKKMLTFAMIISAFALTSQTTHAGSEACATQVRVQLYTHTKAPNYADAPKSPEYADAQKGELFSKPPKR